MSTSLSRKSASESLEALQRGNFRFRNGLRSIDALLSSRNLRDFAENGQRPFSIVVTCSDSRIPTELIFDQGVGDLFVIRIAGNVIPPSALASIEYAMLNFDSALCVVMGHTKCGAIRAAYDRKIGAVSDEDLSPNLVDLLDRISPAFLEFAPLREASPEKLERALAVAARENVRRALDRALRESEAIRARVAEGKFAMIGAIYDVHDGSVVFDEKESPQSVRRDRPEEFAALSFGGVR